MSHWCVVRGGRADRGAGRFRPLGGLGRTSALATGGGGSRGCTPPQCAWRVVWLQHSPPGHTDDARPTRGNPMYVQALFSPPPSSLPAPPPAPRLSPPAAAGAWAPGAGHGGWGTFTGCLLPCRPSGRGQHSKSHSTLPPSPATRTEKNASAFHLTQTLPLVPPPAYTRPSDSACCKPYAITAAQRVGVGGGGQGLPPVRATRDDVRPIGPRSPLPPPYPPSLACFVVQVVHHRPVCLLSSQPHQLSCTTKSLHMQAIC